MSTKTHNSEPWSAALTSSGFEVHTLVRGKHEPDPSLMIMIVNPKEGHGYIVYLLSDQIGTEGLTWRMYSAWNMQSPRGGYDGSLVEQGSYHSVETLRRWWINLREAKNGPSCRWEELESFKEVSNGCDVVRGIERCAEEMESWIRCPPKDRLLSFLQVNKAVFNGGKAL